MIRSDSNRLLDGSWILSDDGRMRRTQWLGLMVSLVLLLLAGCRHDLTDVPRPSTDAWDAAPDAPLQDAVADVPLDNTASDIPVDLPPADQGTDKPSPDVPPSDLPPSDLPPDLPPADLPPPDLPPPDLKSPDSGTPDGPVAPPPIKGTCNTDKWCWMNPRPQGDDLNAVWGAGASDAFAVGPRGTLLQFDGSAWKELETNTFKDLRGVGGSSKTDVYVVGDSGTVLHHDGLAWLAQKNSNTYDLYGVWSDGAGVAVAVGASGAILRYDTTAKAWKLDSNLVTAFTSALYGIWGSSKTDLYAVGEAGSVLHNDGTGWKAMTSGTTKDLYAVWGDGKGKVYAAGEGGTILSHEAKAGWKAFSSTGATCTFQGIGGDGKGEVVAVGKGGKMVRLTGTVWKLVTTGTTRDLSGVWLGGTAGHVVGKAGTLLRLSAGAWKPAAEAITTDNLRGVWGTGVSNVYAVGDCGVLRYDGLSWKTTSIGSSYKLNEVWGSGPSDVYAVGLGGIMFRYDGVSWKLVKAGTSHTLYGVWGTSASDVYVAGGTYTKGNVVLHYNGNQWKAVVKDYPSAGSFNSVWGSGSSDVYAAGYKYILHFDGLTWKTWKYTHPASVSAIWGTSATNFYFILYGNYVFRSDGKTYKQDTGACCSSFYDISGHGSDDIYAVGDKPHTYHWDGKKWNLLKSGTGKTLQAVWVDSSGEAFAVGDDGAVLRRKP